MLLKNLFSFYFRRNYFSLYEIVLPVGSLSKRWKSVMMASHQGKQKIKKILQGIKQIILSACSSVHEWAIPWTGAGLCTSVNWSRIIFFGRSELCFNSETKSQMVMIHIEFEPQIWTCQLVIKLAAFSLFHFWIFLCQCKLLIFQTYIHFVRQLSLLS